MKEREYRPNGELVRGTVTRTGVIQAWVFRTLLSMVGQGGLTVLDVIEIAKNEFNEEIKFDTAARILNSIKFGLKGSPDLIIKITQIRANKTKAWVYCMYYKK